MCVSLEKKLHNFRFAWNGIRIAWQEEFSFRIQVIVAILASLMGWYFGISTIEWLLVVTTIAVVLSAEAFNTALEELCDKFRADPDPHIGKIKDLAAGAVLVASAAAFIVGAIIFLPRIIAVL